MKPFLIGCASLVLLAGCHGGLKHRMMECVPFTDECPEEEVERPVRRHARPVAKAEAQDPEEVVVRAPRQKIVVEMPPAAITCQPPAQGANCQPHAPNVNFPTAAPGPSCQPPGPAAPCQQAPPPPCQPPAQMPPMAQTMPTATAEVKQKTRLGFMFDTIRIPLPIIRPVAVPQPAEMTMTMPMAAAPMMP